MSKLTLTTVKGLIESEMDILELDFNTENGDKAKLLHKHYKRILTLLENVE